MRFAYLNVWGSTSSEAHAGETLKITARRLGVDIIPCHNNADVEAAKPDFVITISRTQAKLTGFPTYHCVNEPSTVYMREPRLLHYFCGYDGYLTLSDSLAEFTRNALYGVGRYEEEIGSYYNCAHRQEGENAPIVDIVKRGEVQVAYFGTNWDVRRANFFRLMGAWDKAALYGPERSWEHMNLAAYRGSVPYDGASVQNVYRKTGIGLNILADHHLQEDVISNRVFEITSVGAACISCRMPWLEKHFGDTLYYVDQEVSDKRLLESVQEAYARIVANPEEAAAKAAAARRIFEEKFALEHMVESAVAFHKRKQARLAAFPRDKAPLISVLMKSNGQRLELLRRAVQSVAAQDHGRFQIVLVKTAPFDFSYAAPSHVSLDVIDGKGLYDGLREARGDYVALLQEDHEWFPQHITHQLEVSAAGCFVHGALVEEHEGAFPETAWIDNGERRGLTHQADASDKDIMTALDLIAASTILAPAQLFDADFRRAPSLASGEERDFVMGLIARARPKQSFAATCLLRKADALPQTKSDSAAAATLLLRHWRDHFHLRPHSTMPEQLVGQGYRTRAYQYETERVQENGITHERLKKSRFDHARLQPMPLPWVQEKSFFRYGLSLQNEEAMVLDIAAPDATPGVAGFLAFPAEASETIPDEYLLVMEMEIGKGQLMLQYLHNDRTLERYNVARSFAGPNRYHIEIPVYYRQGMSGLVLEVQPQTKGRVTALRAFREV